MQNTVIDLCNEFGIEGDFVGFKPLDGGHINSTFLVRFEKNGKQRDFVLQKINKNVFTKPAEVMENISHVTNYVKNKIKEKGENPSRRVLQFAKSIKGEYYTIDDDGEYWRLYKFINNSVTFNNPSLKILNESGKAFGDFQNLLSEYPINKLNIIIPHFHNTVNRYKIFDQVLKQDPCDRVKNAEYEIEQYLGLRNTACKMYSMQQNKELNLRVTHNDTKSNNVLFDEASGEYLCVIDLDTVMPGLVGFDFGDAIRFGANRADEDEKDLSKVELDLNKFKVFTEGFLSTAGNSLTENELKTLSLGAITMTTECGLRFLTDYIDGDNYFKTKYPEHNLVRARCQLKLAKDMINKYNQMQQIVKDCMHKYNI